MLGFAGLEVVIIRIHLWLTLNYFLLLVIQVCLILLLTLLKPLKGSDDVIVLCFPCSFQDRKNK